MGKSYYNQLNVLFLAFLHPIKYVGTLIYLEWWRNFIFISNKTWNHNDTEYEAHLPHINQRSGIYRRTFCVFLSESRKSLQRKRRDHLLFESIIQVLQIMKGSFVFPRNCLDILSKSIKKGARL